MDMRGMEGRGLPREGKRMEMGRRVCSEYKMLGIRILSVSEG